MPRTLSQTFRCEPLRDLTQQMLYQSADNRRDQVRRAEKLHDEIDPHSMYSLEFIKFRITGYRDEQSTDTVFVGEALLPDLRLMIDKISRSAPLPADDGDDPSLRPGAWAARLNVSEKTLSRWRKAGLRWRWARFDEDDAGKLAITQSAVDRFRAGNEDRVDKAAGFSQLSDDAKQRILDRARRIVQGADVSLNQVAVHLAKRTGRAVETIRQILDQHDRQHTESPIFVNRDRPLSPEQKREIAHAYEMGTKVRELAKRFNRTRSTIRRAINDQRAAALRKQPIRYVESPTFSREDADEVILRPEPLAALAKAKANRGEPPSDVPPPLNELYRTTLLAPEHMRSLFTRMNYLKRRAALALDELDPYAPRAERLDRIEADLAAAADLRSELVRLNMPALLSVARRHLIVLEDRSQAVPVLLRVLENCTPVLIDAVEEYDIRRKQPFEDYVTWRVMRNLAIENVAQRVAAEQHAGRAKAKTRRVDDYADQAESLLKRLTSTAKQKGVTLEL